MYMMSEVYFYLGLAIGVSLACILIWCRDRAREREKRAMHRCPFCGSSICVETIREEVSPTLTDYGVEQWRCVCYNCGARGPVACDRYEAERVWYKWP